MHIPRKVGSSTILLKFHIWLLLKKNINDQEPGLILTGNFIKKGVIVKNVILK